jgi:ribonuclease Z
MDRRIEGILVSARSLGGIGTTVSFPELGLTVDLGTCTPAALRTPVLALTHAHADHLAGLAAWLGVRTLYGMKGGRILMPAEIGPAMDRLVGILGELQGRPFDVELVPVRQDEEVVLSRELRVRRFATSHRVPSTGWAAYRSVRKLRREHAGLPGEEIARLKGLPGTDLFETVEVPLVAVTGDTAMDGLDLSEPRVRDAAVLFAESTFVGGARSVDDAHAGHHTHLDEVVERLASTRCRAIVLYHFSQIYKVEEIEDCVRAALPESLASRVVLLLPEEGDRL